MLLLIQRIFLTFNKQICISSSSTPVLKFSVPVYLLTHNLFFFIHVTLVTDANISSTPADYLQCKCYPVICTCPSSVINALLVPCLYVCHICRLYPCFPFGLFSIITQLFLLYFPLTPIDGPQLKLSNVSFPYLAG